MSLDNAIIKEALSKKLISPDGRWQAAKRVNDALDVSKRRACQALGQPRSTLRYPKVVPEDEELKTPLKQPKRDRLWLNDKSIVKLCPEFFRHVWSYDFIQDRTHNGCPFAF